MSDRIKRINSLIAEEMSSLLTREVDFKIGLFVTVSKVDTTSDLRYTRIFVKVFPSKENNYAMKTLEHEKGKLQRILHKKLHLKIIPKISFFEDITGEEFDNLEKILLSEE